MYRILVIPIVLLGALVVPGAATADHHTCGAPNVVDAYSRATGLWVGAWANSDCVGAQESYDEATCVRPWHRVAGPATVFLTEREGCRSGAWLHPPTIADAT